MDEGHVIGLFDVAMDIVLVSVAAGAAFLGAPAGVSGAFLLLPFQLSVLGYTSPSVSATNLVYNVVATPAGIYRYLKEGRFLWPVVYATAPAAALGVALGAYVRAHLLYDPAAFKLFVGLVLLWLGARVLISAVGPGEATRKAERREGAEGRPAMEVKIIKFGFPRVEYEFLGAVYAFSVPAMSAAAFAIGVVSGVYGIGGGSILSPVMASVFKLPLHTTAGACMLNTLITSAFGIASYYAVGAPPNWPLGLILGAGGIAGTYLGARLQKHLPERVIRLVLSALVLAIALTYLASPS